MWIVLLGKQLERTVYLPVRRERTVVETADVEINLTKEEATDLYRKMAMAEYGSKIVLDNGLVFNVLEKPLTFESLIAEL